MTTPCSLLSAAMVVERTMVALEIFDAQLGGQDALHALLLVRWNATKHGILAAQHVDDDCA
jgi:2-keto-4-pentenoate hydratase